MKLNAQQIGLLRKTKLFFAVPESTIVRIAASPDCEIKSFQKGDLVYGRTAFKRCLGIILSGRMRVEKSNAAGKRMIMSTLSSGSLFGAAALFNNESEYATDITALCPTEIIFFTQRLMQRMMDSEPQIATNYIRYLSERILFLNKKIYFLSAGTAEQRLASFLLDNLEPGLETELPMPMHALAAALNISRASLYRAFDDLAECGAISKNGKTVCVQNAERLNNIMR